MAGGGDDYGFQEVDHRQEQEAAVSRLTRHRERNRITESDFRFLVGAQAFQGTLADYAQANSLAYEAAKKRRQRLMATISLAEGGLR